MAVAIDVAELEGDEGGRTKPVPSCWGHDVKVANSRGPETIDAGILAHGARAVTVAEAVLGVDAVIMSVALGAIPRIAPLFADVPVDTIVIDTSNDYPMRDGQLASIEAGQTESEWVAEQMGRPIAPFCCTTSWDSACVNETVTVCKMPVAPNCK